jgi:hypothetical protein
MGLIVEYRAWTAGPVLGLPLADEIGGVRAYDLPEEWRASYVRRRLLGPECLDRRKPGRANGGPAAEKQPDHR